MSDSIENNTSTLLSEGLVVAIITAAVYLSFLLREIGYAQIFDIPLEVISVSNIGLAVTAQSFLIATISYIAKVNLIWIFSPRSDEFIATKTRALIAYSLLIGFAFYPYFITEFYVWTFVLFIVLLIFFQFIFPIITQRKNKTYRDKLIAQETINYNSVDIYSSFRDELDNKWRKPFAVLLAIMFFSYGLGRKEALEKSSFFAVDSKPGWYILKIYNDFIVTASIDFRTKRISGEIELTKIKDEASIRLHKVEIGSIDHENKLTQEISINPVQIQNCNFLEAGCRDA